MNMREWLQTAASRRKAMPVLSFPGTQLVGVTVRQIVEDAGLQADCMKAMADRYDLLASVSLMDLSVEAEAFGAPVRFADDEVPTVTGAVVQTAEQAAQMEVPKVGAARTGIYTDAIREAKKRISDKPVFGGCIGPFSLAGRLMDMSEIMVLCYEEPEFVHAVLEKATSFLVDYTAALKNAGADGILMAEPAAGLLSPNLIEEFSTPYVNKIIGAAETDECVFIYHNCGNTIPLVESILKTGASAFHFGNAIDLSEILPLIPADKLVFGNVDPAGQFRNGTTESVREATRKLMEACGGFPHFIPSSGCDIPPVSPLENIEAFFQAVAEYYN